MLDEDDEAALSRLDLPYTVVPVGGWLHVTIEGYPLPEGFDAKTTTLLLRLPAGFPDAQPDMFWVDPPIRLARTNAFPPQANLMETYEGRQWQRFSRHLAAGAWRPGIDDLQSWLAAIRGLLEKDVA